MSRTVVAEKQGFEPWEGDYPSTVFKTAALNRSATSPNLVNSIPELFNR
jgi:hypothetical protein